MTNPFDNEDSSYLILVNSDDRHSLWPAAADVPPGWSVATGPTGRVACMEYVVEHWTDIRPSGLTARLKSRGRSPHHAPKPADRPTEK